MKWRVVVVRVVLIVIDLVCKVYCVYRREIRVEKVLVVFGIDFRF